MVIHRFLLQWCLSGLLKSPKVKIFLSPFWSMSQSVCVFSSCHRYISSVPLQTDVHMFLGSHWHSPEMMSHIHGHKRECCPFFSACLLFLTLLMGTCSSANLLFNMLIQIFKQTHTQTSTYPLCCLMCLHSGWLQLGSPCSAPWVLLGLLSP